MGDIVKAIEKEKEYIEYRKKGEEPFHLADAIKECGFESLKEYFEEKKEYEFNNLNFEIIVKDPNDCIAEGLRLLDTQTTGIVVVDCNETFVYSGTSKPFNEEYCEENNIPIYPLYTKGGAIVGAIGDFSMGICVPESLQLNAKYMLEKIKNLLANRISTITIEGNDILQDGMKICATTEYRRNGMFLFIAHFSFSDRIELINEICYTQPETSIYSLRRGVNQPAVKTPGFIKGLAREDLKKDVMEWLRV